jgi:hypothetical protein
MILVVVLVLRVVVRRILLIKMDHPLAHLPVPFLPVQLVIQQRIRAVVHPAARLLGKEFKKLGIQFTLVERGMMTVVEGGVITNIAIEMPQIQVHLQPQPMQ